MIPSCDVNFVGGASLSYQGGGVLWCGGQQPGQTGGESRPTDGRCMGYTEKGQMIVVLLICNVRSQGVISKMKVISKIKTTAFIEYTCNVKVLGIIRNPQKLNQRKQFWYIKPPTSSTANWNLQYICNHKWYSGWWNRSRQKEYSQWYDFREFLDWFEWNWLHSIEDRQSLYC